MIRTRHSAIPHYYCYTMSAFDILTQASRKGNYDTNPEKKAILTREATIMYDAILKYASKEAEKTAKTKMSCLAAQVINLENVTEKFTLPQAHILQAVGQLFGEKVIFSAKVVPRSGYDSTEEDNFMDVQENMNIFMNVPENYNNSYDWANIGFYLDWTPKMKSDVEK